MDRLGRIGACLAIVGIVFTACGGGSAPSDASPDATAASAPAAATAPAATAAAATARSAAPSPQVRGNPGAPGGGGADGVAIPAKLAADLGFRPEQHGFGFENYGKGAYDNLTAAELERLFGPEVCASRAGGKCILAPPAQKWMQEINDAMDGGHCEGFAVLSLLFYLNKLKAADFGAPSPVALPLDGNAKLQREIAYWWATQATGPTNTQEIKDNTPKQILERLQASFAGGAGAEAYTMGIYQPGGKGGHAITPFALEDKGNGLYWVLVYDNNYAKISRAVEIDVTKDSWRYFASTNPSEPASEYAGNAETFSLTLTPLSPREVKQECPFCGGTTAYDGSGGRAAALQPQSAARYNQIWLDGDADLLITDSRGRRYGVADGKQVREIPEIRTVQIRSADLWKDDPAPVYMVPLGLAFTLTVDGSRLKAPSVVDVTMIGPGYDLGVEGIKLEPGQKDTIAFSPDGQRMTYRTQSSESPDLVLGLETKAADFAFAVKGVDLVGGGAITLALDAGRGRISLSTSDSTAPGVFSVAVARIDDAGEEVFEAEDIDLAVKDVLHFGYSKWQGNGKPMELAIDRGGDGTIDEEFEVSDR